MSGISRLITKRGQLPWGAFQIAAFELLYFYNLYVRHSAAADEAIPLHKSVI